MFEHLMTKAVNGKSNGHLEKLQSLHEELKTQEHDFSQFHPCPAVNFCRTLIERLPDDERDDATERLDLMLKEGCYHHTRDEDDDRSDPS